MCLTRGSGLYILFVQSSIKNLRPDPLVRNNSYVINVYTFSSANVLCLLCGGQAFVFCLYISFQLQKIVVCNWKLRSGFYKQTIFKFYNSLYSCDKKDYVHAIFTHYFSSHFQRSRVEPPGSRSHIPQEKGPPSTSGNEISSGAIDVNLLS